MIRDQKSLTIAFDIDGTLLGTATKTRVHVVSMLKLLRKNHYIIVWSGGGKEYAEIIVRGLKLEKWVDSVCAKGTIPKEQVDICFDDEWVNLAQKNIKI